MVVVPLPDGHPKIFSMPTNSINSDNPITTSGMTSGAVMAPANSVFPLNLLNLVIIIAAIVPRTMETVAEMQAILRLVNAALKIIGLETSALYHLKENLVQDAVNLESLNE
jgi:hypothetical protein